MGERRNSAAANNSALKFDVDQRYYSLSRRRVMAAREAGKKEMYAWVCYKRDSDNACIFNANSDHGHLRVDEILLYNEEKADLVFGKSLSAAQAPPQENPSRTARRIGQAKTPDRRFNHRISDSKRRTKGPDAEDGFRCSRQERRGKDGSGENDSGASLWHGRPARHDPISPGAAKLPYGMPLIRPRLKRSDRRSTEWLSTRLDRALDAIEMWIENTDWNKYGVAELRKGIELEIENSHDILRENLLLEPVVQGEKSTMSPKAEEFLDQFNQIVGGEARDAMAAVPEPKRQQIFKAAVGTVRAELAQLELALSPKFR